VKLLFLAPYPPYPPHGGGQQRMWQCVRLLAKQHEIWLLTFSPSAAATEALAALRDVCHVDVVPQPRHTTARRLRTLLGSSLPDMVLRGRSEAYAAAIGRLLAHVPFDVVQAESIETAQYGAQAPAGPLWVYDAWNAEYMLQRRAFLNDIANPRALHAAAYSLAQWHKLRAYEAHLSRRFGGALAVSEQDAAILRRLDRGLRVEVVPNGVDTDFFRPAAHRSPAADNRRCVLFTGSLSFRPNIDALDWFSHAVLPLARAALPELELVVVGRDPQPGVLELGKLPGVTIVGEVPDVRPYFTGAGAYIVPMRIGGGVRLKLLEALSMEQAVVSTPLGAEGVEGLRDGEHVLLAGDHASFAAQLVRLLRDPSLASRLASNGRRLVQERYDWRSIVPRMVEAWHQWRHE